MNKVSFFIVGAPKCGTTTLAKYLEDIPGVCFSKPKEVNYFSAEDIAEQGLYYSEPFVNSLSEYESVFACENESDIKGEGSVSYLFYPNVAKKIHKYNPSAKIIVLTRNPVDRAFSHFLMDERLGYVKKGFEEIFRNSSDNPNHYQQYFLLGRYAEQIIRYIDVFGASQVLVLDDVSLRNCPEAVLKRVCGFVGVEYCDVAENKRAHNEFKSPNARLVKFLYKSYRLRRFVKLFVPKSVQGYLKAKLFSKKGKPKISPTFRRELQNFYRDDIEALVDIVGDTYPRSWLS